MPLLAEGLVAPKTDAWVKKHLEECPECKAIFDAIMVPDSITPNTLSEKQLNRKVNFMKKIHRSTVIKIIVIAAVICAVCIGGYYLLTQVKFYVPIKDMTVEATPLSALEWYDSVIIYSYDVTIDKKYGMARQEDMSKQLIPDEELGNIEEFSYQFSYTLWDYLFRANRETKVSVDISRNLIFFNPEGDQTKNEEDKLSSFYRGIVIPTSVYIEGDSESDRFVLWENLEIFDAMNKILERSADPEAATGDSVGRQIVFENEEVVLRTDISETSGMLQEYALYPVTQEDTKEHLYINLLAYGFSSEELKVLGETGVYNNALLEMTGAEFSQADLYAENAFASVPDDSIVQIMNSTLHVSSETPIQPCIGYRRFKIDNGASASEVLYDPELATAEEYCTRKYRSVTFVDGHREVIQDWADQVNENIIADEVKNIFQPYDENDGSGPL
jgi:hypothetical protein